MRYPQAEWLGNGVAGGTWVDVPWRVVLHTTETRGIPGYGGGASAPHLTYSPATRRWYQHTDLKYAARALRNQPGGVETNRANAIQVEIIAYSSRPTADRLTPKGLWVGDLPDTAYEDFRTFLAWCHEEFGVEYVWPGKQALSASQANTPGFRMTPAQWNSFNGSCGHQHVPEQHTAAKPGHWDPGALDWTRMFPTKPPEDDVALTPAQEKALNWLVGQLDQAGVSSWARSSWDKAVDQAVIRNDTKPGEPVSVERMFTFLERMGAFNQMGGGSTVDLVARTAADRANSRLDAAKEAI